MRKNTERILDYLAVDLETTGLSPMKDRIIEIGAVKYRDGQPVAEFSRLVRTYQPLPERITTLTGITDEMLLSGVNEEEAIRDFLEFAENSPVLLGHSVNFDFSFLKMAALRIGVSFERLGLDTLRFAKALYPDLDSRALTALCAHFGIEQLHAHRATEDAISAHLVYRRMLSEFPEYGGFKALALSFTPKKTEPMTPRQKSYLKALLAHHGMEYSEQMEHLSKSEASRLIDKLILTKGRM